VHAVFDCAGQQRDSTASACSCLCWSAQLTWLSLCWLARFFPEIRRVRGGKGRPEGQSCLFLTARASNVTARPARAAVCVGARSSPGSLSVGSLAFFQKYEESEEGKAARKANNKRYRESEDGMAAIAARRAKEAEEYRAEAQKWIKNKSGGAYVAMTVLDLRAEVSFPFPICSLFVSPFPSLSPSLSPSLTFLSLFPSPSFFLPFPLSLSPSFPLSFSSSPPLLLSLPFPPPPSLSLSPPPLLILPFSFFPPLR
jgi:hypothetical protein